MNSFDIAVLIFLSIFIIRGLFRGIIRELIALIGLVLGYLIAMTYTQQLQEIVNSLYPDLPAIATRIVCFVALFIGTNVVLRVIGNLSSKTVQFAMLGWLNHLLGAVSGLIKSVLIVTVIVFIVNMLPYSTVLLNKIDSENSFFFPLFRILGPQLYEQIQMYI